jgi:hypothetical protein
MEMSFLTMVADASAWRSVARAVEIAGGRNDFKK